MFSSNTTQVSGAAYEISRSLRFNPADSARLNRTFATNGTSRTTSTISFWVKRSALSLVLQQRIIDCYDGSSADSSGVFFEVTTDKLTLRFGGTASPTPELQTTAVYRDLSAWYHVVAVFDSTQGTSTDRIKLYVNGTQVTSFSSAVYPALNATFCFVSSGFRNYIGDAWNAPSSPLFNGYLTEFNYIDGQALTPSSFGATNAQTGVWGPIAYGGSYGTNGFYLNFSDNSNTTAATLGKDYSGNGNNWTPNGFSVTAGVGNDSMVDVPTPYGLIDTGVGGTVRGNYATLNPLAFNSAPGGTGQSTFSEGNLQAVNNAVSWTNCFSTISMNSGKFYFEFVVLSGAADAMVGIYNVNTSVSAITDYFLASSVGYGYYSDGTKATGGTFSGYGANWPSGTLIGTALDLDAGTLTFYNNGTSQGTAFTGLSGNFVFAVTTYNLNSVKSVNFGQRPFAYTAPSGFKALCTQNLPTPTIGATTATQAGKYFNTVLYTGNSSTQSITGVGFQPDWVWGKDRTTALNNRLFDAVRGVTKSLSSNLTSAEATESGVTAFNSDGFTLGSDQGLNFASDSYVAWNWRASNATAVSNTAGTITSQVSASTASGFSVITYSGSAVAATIGHGLGAAPSMIISKRTGGGNWAVYHKTLGINQYVFLNSDAVANTVNDYWGTTSPSSTVFGVIGGGYDNNSGPAVAYCFAPIAGYSAFDSYIGNGSTDGPFVYTGFRPAFLILKSSAGVVQTWISVDSTRFPYNVVSGELYPSTAGAESSGQTRLDFVSNGFKLRTTDTAFNGGSYTYIFMAFASNPFKYSLAR
jgi:hypothetical protein